MISAVESESTITRYLNVAERNDVAKKIASILSGGNPFRREGLSEFNKIYEFEARVFGHPSQMVMTSVCGHLLKYEFPFEFRDWQSCDPEVLFDAPIVRECPHNYENIKKTLEREIKSCQGLIIWTDCDREGENIGFEIFEVCNRIKPNLVVGRAIFFEITEASMVQALENLGELNDNVGRAVDVRQELDLRTGAAFSRIQTLRLRRVFPQNLANSTIVYGSCQIPALGFVVDRQKEIEEFVAQPSWKIKLKHKTEDLTTDFSWKRDKLHDKSACETIFRYCQENPMVMIELVEVKTKIKHRPAPLTTVELLKVASHKLDISPKETMKIAEKLYIQGYISYPRTKTNFFSFDTNVLTSLVEQLGEDDRWRTFAQKLLKDGRPNACRREQTKMVHPPIYPIKLLNAWNDFSDKEKKVYEFIVRCFLACLGKDAIGREVLVHVDLANEKFVAKGLEILEKNYLEVYPYEQWETREIHQYENGDTFTPSSFYLEKIFMPPPQPLTEAELVEKMEEYGIGTDATYANLIEKIKKSKYVRLGEKNHLIPEPLGLGLVEGYNNIGWDLSLAKPNLRADFEDQLKMISEGLKSSERVKREQIEKYKALYRTMVRKIAELDRAVSDRLREQPQKIINVERSKPVLKCSKCNNYMIVRNGTLLSCSGHPICENPIWFPFCTESVEVLDESCGKCGPAVKKLRVKFKQTPFVGEPNSKILCIGGCDVRILETLNIKSTSVRKMKCEKMDVDKEKIENEDTPTPDEETASNLVDESENPSLVGPKCKCGLLAELRMRKTDNNSDRECVCCSKFPEGCDYFRWLSEWLEEVNSTVVCKDRRSSFGVANNEDNSHERGQNQILNLASTSGEVGVSGSASAWKRKEINSEKIKEHKRHAPY